MILVIIPCGKRKRPEPAPAAELYIGSYFKGCLAYARSIAPDEAIMILSAKYGFVPLTRWLFPYDVTFQARYSDVVSLETLAQQVRAYDLRSRTPVIILGGRTYIQYCRPFWPTAQFPLAGCRGMGYQLAWLRNHRGQRPDAMLDLTESVSF